MRLFIIRPPDKLIAIAGGVQIGVPRIAEVNLAPPADDEPGRMSTPA